VFKLKQEVSDETVYHDAVDCPVDEEEDEINDDDCGDGEDEENEADNDQESRTAHDNRCVTGRYFSFVCIISLHFFRHTAVIAACIMTDVIPKGNSIWLRSYTKNYVVCFSLRQFPSI
jgi:hypothetical protein